MARKSVQLGALRKSLIDARDLGICRRMSELQRALGTSRRTVMRYIQELREAGDEVVAVPRKGWMLTRGGRDGALESHVPEQLLVVLRKLGWSLRGTPWHDEMEVQFGKQVRRVKDVARGATYDGATARAARLNKVLFIADFAPGRRAVVSSRRRAMPDQSPTPVQSVRWNDEAAAIWHGVLTAAIDRHPITIDYQSAYAGEVRESRVVHPLAIVLRHGGAYLYALTVDVEDDRERPVKRGTPVSAGPRSTQLKAYAMHRLHSVEVGTTHFTVPKDFNIHTLMGDAVGHFPQHSKSERVVLEYHDRAVAYGIGDHWTDDQAMEVTRHDRGVFLRMTFTTSSKLEVLRRVQAYGGLVRLIEPKAWRRDLARAGREVNRLHKDR